MVMLSNGAKAWVEVEGVEAPEYNVSQNFVEGVETGTCIIEAKEGKEFIIRYRHVPMLQGSTTKILIYIDGIYARGFLRCQYVSPSSSKTCAVMGYPLKQTDTEMTCQSFTFGKMSTTNIGSPKDMLEEIMNGACTIRLDFEIYKRNGDIDDRPMIERTFTIPAATRIHEDCKPALWGLSTKPGQIKTESVGGLCHCSLEGKPSFKQSIIFKYRPRGILLADGVIEPTEADQRQPAADDDDDEVQIDTQRTERMASRRRARIERVPPSRNIRAKREEMIKMEDSVKEEDLSGSSSSTRHTLDVSGNGDGYTVIRPKIETIVIEDDTDDDC